MVSVLLNSAKPKELKYIEDYSNYLASRISDDDWEHHVFPTMKSVLSFLTESPLLDIACVDLTVNGGLDSAKRIRQLNGNTFMMVIADQTVSPMTYISPDVMATSLILRPFDATQLREVMSKLYKTYLKKISENDVKEEVFIVEGKEGKQLIPYDRINYFEAKDKKVFVVTENAEYPFYDTIENLENELPRQFVRSHRGFIVNIEKVTKVLLSQSLIYIDDDIELPLSRSYKSKFKDILTD